MTSLLPECVLSCYGPALTTLTWQRVAGGFSGACVWRGDDDSGKPTVALKRWPEAMTLERLARIHAWMEQAAHLPFVPRILLTSTHETVVYVASQVWDATTWCAGTPRTHASAEEVGIACAATAQLHAAWRHESHLAPSPGIRRRIDVLTRWLANPVRSVNVPDEAVAELLDQARLAIDRDACPLLQALAPWQDVPLRLQPCLRDLRGEHVLFTGTRITGIVDYGAMDVDTPILDLARLLPDLIGSDDALFVQGLRWYREAAVNRATAELGAERERELVVCLARAGATCSLIRWLERIAAGEAPVAWPLLATRLRTLLY